jgi:C4-dicarboxylate transporter DctM subunit
LVTAYAFGALDGDALIMVIYWCSAASLRACRCFLLTVPIFFPSSPGLASTPIWFGIVVVVVVEISLITPPVGLNVFVLKGVVGDVSTGTIFRGVTPFWVVDILRLILLLAAPALVLWLPNQM